MNTNKDLSSEKRLGGSCDNFGQSDECDQRTFKEKKCNSCTVCGENKIGILASPLEPNSCD